MLNILFITARAASFYQVTLSAECVLSNNMHYILIITLVLCGCIWRWVKFVLSRIGEEHFLRMSLIWYLYYAEIVVIVNDCLMARSNLLNVLIISKFVACLSLSNLLSPRARSLIKLSLFAIIYVFRCY